MSTTKKAREIRSEAALLRRLALMGPLTDEQRNAIACTLVGHSRIQEVCFGYYSCARCGQQLGDALGSIYPQAALVVVVGHNCDVCRKNYAACDWRDKVFAPDPFAVEAK